jgi:hypothetical protein
MDFTSLTRFIKLIKYGGMERPRRFSFWFHLILINLNYREQRYG